MATKLEAAEIAMQVGIAVIASGRQANVLSRIFRGEPTGTLFNSATRLRGKKRWIAFATNVRGQFVVNDGAREAVLQGKASFDGQSKLQTWLFAVIRNTAISERRKSLVRSIATPSFENTIDARSQIELERSEVQQRFQAALQRLPARQRETLHLVFYQELSLSEAAQVMSISIGSARQHYERGKKRLRELLDREEMDYGIGWRRKENPGTVL